MPPTVPFNHYKSPRNQQNRTFVLFYYPMLHCSRQGCACFEHSNFLKVNDGERMTVLPATHLYPQEEEIHAPNTPFQRSASWMLRNPTTSFLTATTLIYAIGAGITAGAGTRLVLQLFLVKGFKLYSFQRRDPIGPRIGISCHYLPVLGLGNLRACCLPWKL